MLRFKNNNFKRNTLKCYLIMVNNRVVSNSRVFTFFDSALSMKYKYVVVNNTCKLHVPQQSGGLFFMAVIKRMEIQDLKNDCVRRAASAADLLFRPG